MSAGATRRPPAAVPVTYVAGFLGAGKTTLINQLLRDGAFAGTLVIVNEFGEIALDHDLIETATDGVVLLPSGCLCCAVRGDLVATLEDLLRRLDNGRIPPFTRVVIEPTGLADPVGALQVLFRHPYLALRFRLDGVVCVVDAVNAAGMLDDSPEAILQIVAADCIVLSKTDLVGASAQVAVLRDRLGELAPGIPVLDSSDPSFMPSALIGLVPDSHVDAARLFGFLGEAPAATAAVASARHGNVRSFTLTADEPIGALQLDLFLDVLKTWAGPNLLRVKGIVGLAEHPEAPVLIQAARHLVHPLVELKGWPSADRRTRLVFIVRDIDPVFIARMFDSFRQGSAGATIPPPKRHAT
jgi:G3E family GTPase